MGIASTIQLAETAGEQLHRAIVACETAADAADRSAAILATSDDEEGPIVASRSAAAAWRDELRVVARELGQVTADLDRLVADLGSVQRRLSPTPTRAADAPNRPE